jgi:hypothetical protein
MCYQRKGTAFWYKVKIRLKIYSHRYRETKMFYYDCCRKDNLSFVQIIVQYFELL